MPKELTPSRTADKYILRLPDGMRDQISEAAKANNRSMNAEIVARLRNTFEDTAQAELCLSAESIKKMLLEQEQRLEEKFTKAFSERLNAIKE